MGDWKNALNKFLDLLIEARDHYRKREKYSARQSLIQAMDQFWKADQSGDGEIGSSFELGSGRGMLGLITGTAFQRDRLTVVCVELNREAFDMIVPIIREASADRIKTSAIEDLRRRINDVSPSKIYNEK